MSHLTLDSLARLVDEPASIDEEHHLAVCRACRDALDGFRAQTEALAALPAIAPPPDAWEAVAARLGESAPARVRRRRASVALAQAGASIAAFVRGEHLHEERQRRTFRRAAYVAAAGVLMIGGGVAQSALSGITRGDGPQFFNADGGSSRIESSRSTTDLMIASLATGPVSVDEAVARLRVAELMYHRALLDYSALRNPIAPTDVVARLAALDAIVLTTGAALQRAPADPVINTYHLSALAERQTLLGQIQ